MEHTTKFSGLIPNGQFLAVVVLVFVVSIATAAVAQQSDMSADEAAKKLANPAGSLASLANNINYRALTGALPGADEQSVWSYTFQPVLPFPVGDGDNRIIFRPAFTVTFDQPVPTVGGFETLDPGLNDLVYDLVYAGNKVNSEGEGFLWGFGAAGTMPIASDDALGGDQWRLGPELFGGILRDWGTTGVLVNNQFNLGNSDEGKHNVMSAQYFYGIMMGGGWQVLSGPLVTYDWNADSDQALSFPIGTGIAKMTKIGNTPFRIQLEFWYFVEQPDDFGGDWQVTLDLRPVISNPFTR
jgi:hypothetical protein